MTDYLSDEQFQLLPDGTSAVNSPKILIMYGSLRKNSYSRLLAEEAGRILVHMGAQVKFFNPAGLPLFDPENMSEHEKVKELRELRNSVCGLKDKSGHLRSCTAICQD